MAVPSLTIQQTETATATAARILPIIMDNYFLSQALHVRLWSQGLVVLEGGEDIRQPFIYDELNGGPYTQGSKFNTDAKETMTNFRFTWKKYYANVTITEHIKGTNYGDKAIIDITTAKMIQADMKLKKDIGADLYSAGTDSTRVTGLRNICDTAGTYGGITRGTDVVGTAAKGYIDSTGGVASFPLIRAATGNVTIGNMRPDLYLTTQTIWDKLADRALPQQRFTAPDLAAVGFESIRFMGGDIVVDSNVPSGSIFGLTTSTMAIHVNSRNNFKFTGWKNATTDEDDVAQIILWLELVCGAPRQNFQIQSVT